MLFDKAEFNIVGDDKLLINTKTNGDKITMVNLSLSAEQAARIAYLANLKKPLKVEIKVIT